MRGGAEIPRNSARSLVVVCLAACTAASFLGAARATLPRARQSAPSALSQSPSREIPSDPRALYQALNELRVDNGRIYAVHELDLRRDVISIKFADGKLAFLQPIGGRVTGAVFTGAGHILATPRERGERRSLAQFLGVPILDQNFSRAYFRFTDDTASELRELLAADEASAASNAKPNTRPDETPSTTAAVASDADFVQSWNGILGNLNPSQSLRVMFDLLAAQPQPYFYGAIVSDAAGIFDVLVDGRRDEQVLLGRTRISNGFPLYDVWASFRASSNGDSGSAPAPSFRAFAPLDYRADTAIADDLTIQGRTSLHFKALRAGERVMALELSRNLVVDQVLSSGGHPLVFFQNEELSRREIPRRGNDSVMVVLPEAPAAGVEIRLDVSYRGSVISDAGNGVKFVGEHETWYAHLAGSESFVPFDLTFRWPRRLTLVATGDQVESHDEGDTKTGRWVSRVPFEVAGFNLSEYKTDQIGNGRIQVRVYANKQLEEAILARLERHDSASQESPPPIFLPRPLRGQVEIAPSSPAPPSPASVLKTLGGNILDSIEFFEKLNGPFPFDHLDVSQIPGTFGQGWPGLVYLSTLAFLPPEAEMRVGINERGQEEARELMGPHEAAHQWWGNVVDTNSYRDTWIAEGMANYLALLWADARYPNGHRLETWLERFRRALTTPVASSADTPDDAGPLILGPRLHSSKIPEAYETVIYGKGTWVIHMIHEMLRDPSAKDPDVRFRALLRGILEEYRFRPLSTPDFQRAVEKRMTPAMDLEGSHKMDWFFDEWVRATGIPHYKVEFQVKPRGDEFVVSGKLLQSGVDDVFTAPVPLYAAHAGGKPALLGIVATTGPETRFRFVTRARPVRLQIDPHLTLLRKPD